MTWTVPNEPKAVRRLVRKLEREGAGPVRACYEAGPCGYALQRQMTTTRVSCQMIAPAWVPRKPGERVKTNRRDARKLVELLRAGLLTEVRPPTPEDEAAGPVDADERAHRPWKTHTTRFPQLPQAQQPA